MPTTIFPRTRSASSIDTSPRARNGRRRPRCGAVTIRPSVRKLEPRIKIIAATRVGACEGSNPMAARPPRPEPTQGHNRGVATTPPEPPPARLLDLLRKLETVCATEVAAPPIQPEQSLEGDGGRSLPLTEELANHP